MNLYTFIFVILDGIYVSQYRSSDVHSGLKLWASNLSLEQFITDEVKQNILNDIEEETEFRDMDGMKNVYCTGIRSGKDFGFVHVIKTESPIDAK